jgi:pimeloyl-ACP methyl ester carboxylesterase
MSWQTAHHTVDLPEGRIRYRELGSGSPLLFVHGLLVNGNLWRAVAPALARQFRCIVPDWPIGSHEMPMHADADLGPAGLAELIVRFADALRLENVTLVGNDTGGALCQLAIASHPRRFAGLVLTNCDAFENFFPPRYRYLPWIAHLPPVFYLLAQSMRLSLVRRLPIAYGPLTRRPLPRDISDSYALPFARSAEIRRDLGKTLRGISPTLTLAAAEKLPQFTGRSLLVWSDDDPIFPFDYAMRLARKLPGAEVEKIHGSRTFVPEDQPAALAARMASFLRAGETPIRQARA